MRKQCTIDYIIYINIHVQNIKNAIFVTLLSELEKQKTTIHEIAKALNTTASTVSRALNNNPRISDKMKKRVLDMANKLGYEPNIMASALRNGQSKLIGIIVPYADRVFFSSAIRGIEEEVKKFGFNVIICQSYEKLANEIDDINALLSAQVAGIIISISKETNRFEHLQKVLDKKKPLILFDRVTNKVNTCSVVIDDFQGAYQSVTHLIENGYRNIAFFTGKRNLNIYVERYRGYKAAIEENGLVFNDDFVMEISSDVEEGKMAMQKLMSAKNKPDAVFSSSDHSALGALKWLTENNYRVPEDVGVVGFSNEPFTQYLEPSLTSVDQKSRQMGETTAKVFLEQLSGKGGDVARKIFLSPELIIRKSSTNSLKGKIAV